MPRKRTIKAAPLPQSRLGRPVLTEFDPSNPYVLTFREKGRSYRVSEAPEVIYAWLVARQVDRERRERAAAKKAGRKAKP